MQNYGHLVTIGGVRVLHVGDVEVSRKAFAPYDLADKEIDVAFVPYWFFGSDEGVAIIRDLVNPARVIACHIPPAQRAEVIAQFAQGYPGVHVFSEPMESISLPGRRQKEARATED